MLNGIQLDALLYRIVGLLLAIAVHDAVQAAVASLMGDRTAREERRMTLNPLAHLSAVGLLPVLFGPFGWSRPVPVDRSRLPGRSRLRMTVVYLAGPVANAALAIALWGVSFHFPGSGALPSWLFELLRGICQWGYIASLMLILFQLLPLYPMDLWKTIRAWLPEAWGPGLDRRERWGMAVLLGLAVTPFGQLLFQRGYERLSQWMMNLYAWS